MFKKDFCRLLLPTFLLAASLSVQAQVDEHKAEIGAQFTTISLTDFHARLFPGTPNDDTVIAGVGGRFGYTFTKHIALDTEFNFFPEDHFLNEELGQKVQAFAGIKAGVRKDHFGVFAKARPGVMWFGDLTSTGGCSSIFVGSICRRSHDNNFALDLGGVVEYYPTKRLIVRGDIGDTLVHYPEVTVGTVTPVVRPAAIKSNLQVSIGVGWRF